MPALRGGLLTGEKPPLTRMMQMHELLAGPLSLDHTDVRYSPRPCASACTSNLRQHLFLLVTMHQLLL